MDTDDYPLLMRNAMRDSMLRTRVGALVEDECGSPAGYDTSGSAIRSHSLFAVGSWWTSPFALVEEWYIGDCGGVLCRAGWWGALVGLSAGWVGRDVESALM